VWVLLGLFALPGCHYADESGKPAAPTIDRYVALGDSYTSGAGILPLDDAGCFRSKRNYPHLIAAELGDHVHLADVSCGGATTTNAEVAESVMSIDNAPQLLAVDKHTDLVTVSLGINDAGFSTLLQQCPTLAPSDPTGAPCQASFQTPEGDSLLAQVDAVSGKLTRVLDLVKDRAPDARVMVVGYPQLVPASGSCPELPFAAGDYGYARDYFERLGATMSEVAHREHVTYIDVLDASAGHDVCAGDDAWVLGEAQSTRTMVWHPFASEERAVADMVLDALNG
jgi:lysophospholipase L1-like esterase